MQKPSLDLSVNLNIDTHTISVTDATDYGALGLDDGVVAIALEITTPAGLLYINENYNTPATTPDITSGSYSNNAMPLDNDGKFMKGTYKVKVNWWYGDTEELFEYILQESIDYEKPCVKVDHESDCFCANFTSTDATDYTGSEELTYDHTIYYPSEADEDPVVVATLEWVDNRLANGVYVTKIASERKWVYGDFTVQATLNGKVRFEVDCSKICDIKCSFNGLWDKYIEQKGTDSKSAAITLSKIHKATSLWTLITLNRKCGQVDTSNSYMTQLKEILGDCDCEGCDGDEDIWVTGVCGSISGGGNAFDYLFESCNNLFTVTPTQVNDTTIKYTFCLNADVINTLVTNQFNVLWDAIQATLNESWFTGLVTSGLAGFPTGGTEDEQKQYLLDQIAALQSHIAPVAQPDTSTTAHNTTVENLVTLNDFFTSNVTVTITTPPSNGVATVKADGKTLRFVPTTGFSGTDVVGYTITDGNGNTASSTWTIIVNPVVAIACSTVTPIYNASMANSGIYLAITLVNLTDYGTNVPTSEVYTVQIRNASNSILHSYTVTGSVSTDPTTYITADAIASNWDNVRILLTTTSDASTGGACGTVTYETPTPFEITDIVTSWFEGLTIPALFGILTSDTEIQKKDKVLSTIDSIAADVAAAQTDILQLQTDVAAIDPAGYTDISGSVTVNASFSSTDLQVRQYNTGTISVMGRLTYSGTVAADHSILTGLPLSFAYIQTVPAEVSGDTADNAFLRNVLGSLLKVGPAALPDQTAGAGNTELDFYYEYKIG